MMSNSELGKKLPSDRIRTSDLEISAWTTVSRSTNWATEGWCWDFWRFANLYRLNRIMDQKRKNVFSLERRQRTFHATWTRRLIILNSHTSSQHRKVLTHSLTEADNFKFTPWARRNQTKPLSGSNCLPKITIQHTSRTSWRSPSHPVWVSQPPHLSDHEFKGLMEGKCFNKMPAPRDGGKSVNKIPAPRANKYCVGSQGLATKCSGWG